MKKTYILFFLIRLCWAQARQEDHFEVYQDLYYKETGKISLISKKEIQSLLNNTILYKYGDNSFLEGRIWVSETNSIQFKSLSECFSLVASKKGKPSNLYFSYYLSSYIMLKLLEGSTSPQKSYLKSLANGGLDPNYLPTNCLPSHSIVAEQIEFTKKNPALPPMLKEWISKGWITNVIFNQNILSMTVYGYEYFELKLLTKADFNNDGLEDMLCAKWQPKLGVTRLILLTRKSDKGTLEEINFPKFPGVYE